jgi:thioredoxin 1
VIQTEDNFRSHIRESNRLCLVDSSPDWCRPCSRLSATINALADQHVGKVFVCKFNVEDVDSVARRYKVQAIPTVVLFENGLLVEQAESVRSERFYRAMLDARLSESHRGRD